MPESEDRYRERYLDLLDELDAKEKDWAALDQRLRRLLAHLLIVSEGPGSPEISAELVQVREGLKQGLDMGTLEERVEALKERVLRETRWADEGQAQPPAHHILIHLVERFPLPPDLAEDALALVEDLEPGVSPDGLPEAIDRIAGLVYRVRSRMQEEKRELEALLREVTDQLEALDQGLTAAHQEARESLRSNRTFDEAVQAQVRGLQTRSEEAADLAELRDHVQHALESIRDQLGQKREEDRDRETSLEREVERLRSTVASLEGQVSEYREKTRQAREASLRDPLTGCFNRLAYQERVQTEQERWQRYGGPLSLVVFDIDRFKGINDSFGHRAGDQVLKTVAQIAASQVRKVDFFARYGGEEFVAVLPETALDAASVVAEKVRKAVEAFRFHSRGRRVPITLSGGVAAFGSGDTLQSVFERADRALYAAKGAGRNRCLTEREAPVSG